MYKLGDIVRNEWASNDNPTKVGVVTKSTRRRVYVLTLDGDVNYYNNDKDLRLTVIGSLDFTEWERLSNETAATPTSAA